eukprot:scaffold8460_cov286-Pinguiococcus_pyrenoidosus.AAC.2
MSLLSFASGVAVSGVGYYVLMKTLESRRKLLIEQLIMGKGDVTSSTKVIMDDLYGNLKLQMPKPDQVGGIQRISRLRFDTSKGVTCDLSSPQEASEYTEYRQRWNASVQAGKEGIVSLFRKNKKPEAEKRDQDAS